MWSYSCMLVKVTAWMCKSIFIYPKSDTPLTQFIRQFYTNDE